MPPVTPEWSDLHFDERDLGALVPPPRHPSDLPLDSSGELSAIPEARRRDAAQRNAAAAELFEAGQYAEAVLMFETALSSCRAVLGPRHPDTLRVAGNLGVALVAAGEGRDRVRQGLRLIEATVDVRNEVLGADHPDTLTALNALAVAHRRAGHADKALELAKKAVLARSRALGPAHPDTLTSRLGLALALAATGDTAKAHKIMSSTLSAAEEELGPQHDHLYALIECGEEAGLLRREV